MIKVKALSKNYGASSAVKEISFTAESGQVVGFLGSNGAGKTTTLRMLSTYLLPSGGTAEVAGFDVITQGEKVRENLGYLPENPPLYGDMTVREYLDFVATIKGVYSRPLRKERLLGVLEKCFLTEVGGKLCRDLSKGYKQRVGLAGAIINDPAVIILDEPTSGLDPKQIIQIRDLIKDLGKTKTLLLSTHLLQEVQAVCDKVVIIASGKITFEGEIKQLDKDQLEEVVMDKLSGEIRGEAVEKVG